MLLLCVDMLVGFAKGGCWGEEESCSAKAELKEVKEDNRRLKYV